MNLKNAAGGAVVRCFLEAFHVAFADSLPGTCILLAIAIAGVAVSKVVPLKLPIVAYVSIIGLLAASPIPHAVNLSLHLPERSISPHLLLW